MEHILLLAYFPERVEMYGGRRRDLPWLLRRYCWGATRVVVYEARETIWDVPHVMHALEHWQASGGYVSMAPATGRTWDCERCQVTVWLAHQPPRWRCRLCRTWMVRKR